MQILLSSLIAFIILEGSFHFGSLSWNILIKIIEIFKKIQDDDKIQKINEIKNIIRENAEIIQQYALIKDQTQLSEKLVTNFEEMYNRMTIQKENKDKDYYDKLGYILFKEIKKVTDVSYRYKILEKILLENEIIKKSNNIFQILLKNYLKSYLMIQCTLLR